MGLTFAKSGRFGAVRFNFSGSGIGMSVGVPGLRIGTGPRGAYISGGVGGFRYRSSGAATQGRRLAVLSQPRKAGAAETPQPNIVETSEHDTACVLQLTDSSSDDLLRSMNEQRNKSPVWPVASAIAVVVYFWASSLMGEGSEVWRLLLAIVLAALVAWLY